MALSKLQVLLLASFPSLITAQQFLRSTTSSPCQNLPNATQFNSSGFEVSLTPENNSLAWDVYGNNSYSGPVILSIILATNDYQFLNVTLDPCTAGDASLCPSSAGEITLLMNSMIPDQPLEEIPEEVFTAMESDAVAYFFMNDTRTGEAVGCVMAELENGMNAGNESSSGNNTTGGGGSGSANDSNEQTDANATEDAGNNETGNGDASGAASLAMDWRMSS